MIRRTHGAALHYLAEIHECAGAYEQWKRRGGHPVHIFNAETVANMPRMIPSGDLDDGLRAWALGVAYALIAKRGSTWYWNLVKDVTTHNYQSRLVSTWDGVAFERESRRDIEGALKSFVDGDGWSFCLAKTLE